MRVLVVDDEAPARRKLLRLLKGAADVEVVGEAADGEAAVEAIRSLSPDLVFLDVRMPGLDGFGVVRQVGAPAMPRWSSSPLTTSTRSRPSRSRPSTTS